MRTNTKTAGDIAELAVATKLAERGYVVSRPLSDNAPYDMIIDDGTRLSKVQVKARSERDGKILVELYTSMSNYKRVYQEGDFDLIAIYNIETKEIALLPWEEVSKNPKSFVLRTRATLNNQTANVRMFDDYKI